ncbi:MAG: autotransporter outer membrane beta-barrel domain-containing protein [Hyphomicrobiales bacterium]
MITAVSAPNSGANRVSIGLTGSSYQLLGVPLVIGNSTGFPPGTNYSLEGRSTFNNAFHNITITCQPAGTGGESVQAAGTLVAQRHTSEIVTSAVSSEVTGALLGSGSSGSAGLAFTQNSATISLEQLMAMNANRKRASSNAVLAYGEDGQRYDPTVPTKPMAYNVWGRVNYGDYNGDDATLDGSVTNFLVGFDRRFNGQALLGIIAGYEISDFDFGSVDGKLEGQGPTLGVYAGIKLSPQLVADVSVTHSWVTYDSAVGAVTADYDASRWTIGGSLTGSFDWNGLTIQPTAKAFVSIEAQDAYVDSSSTAVASRDVTIGRVSFGPKVLYPHMFESGHQATFWALAKAEYDFSSEDTTSSSLLTSDDVFSARIGVGVDTQISDNASLGLAVEGHGLGGGEYTAVDVTGRAKVQF